MANIERVHLATEVDLAVQRIPGAGPTLVFLHEGLGSIGQWKGFPEDLCTRTGLPGLVYDRSGYGGSSGSLKGRQVTYLHEAAIELQALLNAGVDGEYFLVGHSDGGSIALIHAATQDPSMVGCLTMAAHVIVEDETVAGIDPAVEAFENGKLKGLEKFHPERIQEVFFAWADIWRTPGFRSWNICNLIRMVKTPVLSIQGDQDQYGTSTQLELISQHCDGPVQVRMLEGAGHSPHLDKREEVLELFQEFIRDHAH